MSSVQHAHDLGNGQVMLELAPTPLPTRDPEKCSSCELLIRCMGSGRLTYPHTDGHKFTYHVYICGKCDRVILECQLGTRLGGDEVFQYWQEHLAKIPDCWNKKTVSRDIFYCDGCRYDR